MAITRAFVAQGANVMMCARDKLVLAKARRQIERVARGKQRVLALEADVGEIEDVDRLVSRTLAAFGRLHILVNNAAIEGPKGLVEEVNWEDWVQTHRINLLGSVLLCRAVLPHFKKHRYGKIIQLSGGGATLPLPRSAAYATSKAAVVRFAETLAEEVRENGIDVNALAPGSLNTRFLDEVLRAGPKSVGKDRYKKALRQKQTGGTPLEKGADLAVFLASSHSDGITGKLISAVWDPWKSLLKHRGALESTDIYTLRRIVPKGRGQAGGTLAR